MGESNRRQELARLDRELEQIEPADEQGRQLIADVRAELRRALDRADEHPADESLIEQLQDTIYHFEATHPDLTLTLNTVVTALSNMGL